MSEISDLESRISAAMDRISRGLEGLPAAADPSASADAEALEAVRAEVENEKLANTQLEERVKALNSKLEEAESALADANDAVEKAAAAREAAEEQLHEAKVAHEAALAEAQTTHEAAMAEAQAGHEAAMADAQEKGAAEAEAKAAEANTIDLDENRDTIGQLASRLRRLRQTSRQVRSFNQQLRLEARKGLSDPGLINQSVEAELENLKAMRAAELAEMDVIMAALRPMLGQDTPASDVEEGDA